MSAATVVILTTSYPRHDGDGGGHFVAAEARERVLRGERVHVFAPGLAPARAVRDGVEVHWLGGERLFGWPGLAARLGEAPWRMHELGSVARELVRSVAALGPVDAVVAHWLVPCAFPAAWLVDAPLDAVAHGGDVRLLCALPRAVRCALVAAIVKRARSVRFAAAQLRDELAASLPHELRCALLDKSHVAPPPLGLDADAVRASRAAGAALRQGQLDAAKVRPLVVLAGRLVAEKRFDLGLRAIAALSQQSGACAVLVGDGPARAGLERLARELEIPWVALGLVPRDEALAAIAAADVLLHTSASEGAPTVVREARALGVPVVATAAGDIVRWAATDGGLVVASPEPKALAAALSRTLAQRCT